MATHSINANVWLDNAAGTPVDLTNYITTTGFEPENETSDSSTLGSAGREHTVGLEDGGEIQIEGPLTTLLYNQLVAIKAAGVLCTYMVQPIGAGTGNPEISVEVHVTKLGFGSNPDDTAMITATLKAHGAATLGVDA